MFLFHSDILSYIFLSNIFLVCIGLVYLSYYKLALKIDLYVRYASFFVSFYVIYTIISITFFKENINIGLKAPFPIIYGPILYTTLKFLNKSRSVNYRSILVHFIPTLLFIIIYTLLLTSSSLKAQLFDYYYVAMYAYAGISILIYAYLSYLFLHDDRNQKIFNLRQMFLEIVLCSLFISLGYLAIIINLFSNNQKLNINTLTHFTLCITSLLLIKNYLKYKINKIEFNLTNQQKSKRNLGNINKEPINTLQANELLKSTKEVLRETDLIKLKIEELSIDVFLDHELNLDSLSKHLKISKTQLTQFLGTTLQTNFSKYVNSKRIEYSKEIIWNQPDLTIDDVAFKSGFSSRSSFYRSFSENCKMTPVEFKKINKIPISYEDE